MIRPLLLSLPLKLVNRYPSSTLNVHRLFFHLEQQNPVLVANKRHVQTFQLNELITTTAFLVFSEKVFLKRLTAVPRFYQFRALLAVKIQILTIREAYW